MREISQREREREGKKLKEKNRMRTNPTYSYSSFSSSRATLEQIRRENDLLRRELQKIAAQCVGRLQVRVVSARHVQPTNFFTKDADPYVLLTVDKQTARTKTIKHSKRDRERNREKRE